jgi:hypothetical protein
MKELLILYVNGKSAIIILLYHVLKIKIRTQTNIWSLWTYMYYLGRKSLHKIQKN